MHKTSYVLSFILSESIYWTPKFQVSTNVKRQKEDINNVEGKVSKRVIKFRVSDGQLFFFFNGLFE